MTGAMGRWRLLTRKGLSLGSLPMGLVPLMCGGGRLVVKSGPRGGKWWPLATTQAVNEVILGRVRVEGGGACGVCKG